MVDTNRRWQAAGFYTQMIIKHTEKQKTANKLEVIIYWSLAAESILTVKFSKNEIRDFLDNPFTLPSHKALKNLLKKLWLLCLKCLVLNEVMAVFGRCNAHKLVPNVKRKADFDVLL